MVDTHGRFVWYELMTTDLDAAKTFYCRVMGWGARDASMRDMAYSFFTAGEIEVGGPTKLSVIRAADGRGASVDRICRR